ncbi:MAG: ribulokinase [Anaerolineaceae bacterium]|nr:ribulokinase [Anaerolineaceae bacterium]MDE0329468.1 ribulokinase [Anaerolineaceae bacterium]
MYTIGVDFGTESGRALLVDTRDGREVASAVHDYASGVIDRCLPGSDRPLPPDWALQDPQDYLDVLENTIPAVLRDSGLSAAEVVGIAIDFTACTMLPVMADGTPLCFLDDWRGEPHAWIKLWKHHAAQPQADRINAVAEARGESWLPRYGGKISSEWFFSKALQILEEAPEVYHTADRLIEAADWVIWQLCGVETRNACTAGYKALVQDEGYPERDYFAALNESLADVVDSKMSRDLAQPGERAGGLCESAAALTGLAQGTAVAVANVDAHVAVPAMQVTQPGSMVIIMGTSNCHMLVSEELREVPGMCGVVRGGILPGYYGYEAGQSGVGDIFAWFVEEAVPPEYHHAARAAGMGLHEYLSEQAALQKPGEHGLLALDWWNGNRSVLVDADLGGLLVGATLGTRAPDIYRALIEATAFGTREIISAFEESGIPVDDIVAAGGLAEKNPLLLQIYADVTGKSIRLSGSSQGPALGSAMHAAVAAGIYDSIEAAAAPMGKLRDEIVRPIAAHRAVYDQIYADYRQLHDYFGRGANDVMKRLRGLRHAARSSG